MNRNLLLGLLGTTLTLGGVAALTAIRGPSRRRTHTHYHGTHDGAHVLSIVDPYITPGSAECFLNSYTRLPPGRVNLVIDTYGGSLTGVMMIVQALAERRPEITAVVPHVAFSGGTLIMLCAASIIAGPAAFGGPVDPQIEGCPGREMPAEEKAAGQYVSNIRAWVELLLGGWAITPEQKSALQALLLGEEVPHHWPIYLPTLASMGAPVRVMNKSELQFSSNLVATNRAWYGDRVEMRGER